MKRPEMMIFDYGHTLCYEPEQDYLRGWRAAMEHAVANPRGIMPEQLYEYSRKVYADLFRQMRPLELETDGLKLDCLLYTSRSAGDVLLELFKGLSAYHMFDAAGVLRSRLRADAHVHQPVGNQCMAFVYFLCDLAALIQKCYKPVLVHLDVAVRSEIFHGHADAWFGKGQLIRCV